MILSDICPLDLQGRAAVSQVCNQCPVFFLPVPLSIFKAYPCVSEGDFCEVCTSQQRKESKMPWLEPLNRPFPAASRRRCWCLGFQRPTHFPTRLHPDMGASSISSSCRYEAPTSSSPRWSSTITSPTSLPTFSSRETTFPKHPPFLGI